MRAAAWRTEILQWRARAGVPTPSVAERFRRQAATQHENSTHGCYRRAHMFSAVSAIAADTCSGTTILLAVAG
jgi:hypothetical protein